MVGNGGMSKGARMTIVDTQGTRQKGFSLLELLITIGIAGILLGPVSYTHLTLPTICSV